MGRSGSRSTTAVSPPADMRVRISLERPATTTLYMASPSGSPWRDPRTVLPTRSAPSRENQAR
eukprot:223341-Alexandrium_andersonii.AAC.1